MFLAIDIGGTSIKFAIIDKEKNILAREVSPTPNNVDKKITDLLVEVAKKLRAEYDFTKIGVSSSGVIDVHTSQVIDAGPNIDGFIGIDFKKEVGDVLGLEIFVDNDVNSALAGELVNGAGQDLEEVFCIALGTGIGGAYFAKSMLTGSNFALGEIGKTLYDPKTKTNYEERASTLVLDRRIREEYNVDLSVKDFFDKCKEENKECLSLLDSWLEEVVLGISNMVLILDPKYIILGGAISKQGDYIINLIDKKFREIHPIKSNKTKFLAAKLDNDAALYGAVAKYL